MNLKIPDILDEKIAMRPNLLFDDESGLIRELVDRVSRAGRNSSSFH
jgi:hypothetical protein